MTFLEYLCGLALFLFGFNFGFYEAGRGLKLDEFKKLYRAFLQKLMNMARS